MPAPATFSSIVIDCADPVALAAFYQQVTGWEVTASDPDFASLGGGPVGLSFQRVADHRAPAWPDASAQVHLDFAVADLAAATEAVLLLGARRADHQPGGSDWVVFLDPAGHPFCLAPTS
jgi:predicted enzyme related to lactoylglutathione lyase